MIMRPILVTYLRDDGEDLSLSLTADFLSQISPAPLPVGSTMAVIGIPIIMAILFKKQ